MISIEGINYLPVAVDIGNSRIKVLAGDDYFTMPYTSSWEIYLEEFLNNIGFEHKIYACSYVREIAFINFAGIVNRKSDILQSAEELLKNQTIINYSDIAGIGDDRLFGLIGAYYPQRTASITIDCGTAVTVNAIDSNGKCLGGVIFAGAFTQMKGLASKTEKLFDIEFNMPERVLGINTRTAINSGILHSIAGGIKDIINRILEETKLEKPRIILTGGYSNLIERLLDIDGLERNPRLVLDGIQMLLSEKYTAKD